MKHRQTRQRKIILAELCKLTSHPTADELYEIVRQYLPRISLGTVYRNLELLAEQGEVLILDAVGSRRRFDGNVQPHFHVRCVGCGSVGDVIDKVEFPLSHSFLDRSGYKIEGFCLDFTGLCPRCLKENRSDSEHEKSKDG